MDSNEKEYSPAGGDGRSDDPGLHLRLPGRQQEGSGSSKTTAQDKTAEQTGQTQGGELGEAQELGPEITKIMNSSLYRYGEWGLLEVDPSDGHTVRSLGPAERLYIPGSRPSSSLSPRPSTTSASTTASRPGLRAGSVKDGTPTATGARGQRRPHHGRAHRAQRDRLLHPIDHTYADSVPGATLTPETCSRVSTRSLSRYTSQASTSLTATSSSTPGSSISLPRPTSTISPSTLRTSIPCRGRSP